ncbi:hypothetical protein OGH69_12975 [Flavobacterium sp. MFBS3-15]|uniref:hypothetical protein n=1 Tax=Flavobacterium sp. MFBS3-15 TaxID=2989816 RepID=UPI002235C565|nr:hypothetical protein [Flavobacterium sp. MFBS3-15]MCW4469886.1 hypothetical protein [Flavobacterium sp. MFBS3-15]
MNQLETIKSRLIDRITASKNEKLLSAIENIFIVTEEPVTYTPEQFEMLMLAEDDIKYGNVTSQEDLDKMDEEWLK